MPTFLLHLQPILEATPNKQAEKILLITMLDLMLRGSCVIAIAWTFISCATEPAVVGRYSSHVSAADVQQLKLLVRSDRELDHRLVEVDAIAPDRVRIKVGGPNRGEEGSNYTTLVAMKRGRTWIFDPKAGVETEGTVIAH